MAGKVVDLTSLLELDDIGVHIANLFVQWQNGKVSKLQQWEELRQYIYATDTRHTTAGKLPWSNTTTRPKLTQIRDNLFANYIATMFPKRRWLQWEGSREEDEAADKVSAIKDYMMWAVNQKQFKEEIKKLVADYIDYGNCFGTVEWVDESTEDDLTGLKLGFVGPRPKRIPPTEFHMNPVSPSFDQSPKIWRVLLSIGEAKEVLERLTKTPEDKEIAQKVFDYGVNLRATVGAYGDKGSQFMLESLRMDGFPSYREYLGSDYVELLFFAGNIFAKETGEFLRNRLIVVMDRHKIALNVPYPYPLAEIPIFHAGWRIRQDNLWAMGPLENLVGLQYRLDHIENMKADVMDLITYPVTVIRGTGAVGNFEWAPGERIYVDTDGDVDLKSPDVNALAPNIELQQIEATMEEMAGSPKEAMGFRTPGEKTAYEVQRLENAASRIFQNKISQFEEQIIEPLLNAMLVLAREHLDETTIRTVSDDEYGVVSFREITRGDLAANGRLKPIAARHFAEQAEMIQNLTNWASSPLGADPEIKQHFSSVRLARMIEDVLNLGDYEIVMPYIRHTEQIEAQKLAMASQEAMMNEALAPTGLTPDDFSMNAGTELGALEGAEQTLNPTEAL